MAINNVSVQHNGGFLPGIMLLTQCYYHRGTCLNATKRFILYLQPMIPPTKRFGIFFPLTEGCSEEGLDCVQIFLLNMYIMRNTMGRMRENPPNKAL